MGTTWKTGDKITAEKLNDLEARANANISSIEQTTTSEDDDGINVVTVNLGNGDSAQFKVKNGSKGSVGAKGDKGDTGATGAKGDKGDTGEKGSTGSAGVRGSRWNTGTAITGTSTTATVFATGITDSLVDDMYLNTSTGDVYKCTTAGNASTAKWVYAGNIKGATGTKGSTGNAGAAGASVKAINFVITDGVVTGGTCTLSDDTIIDITVTTDAGE